MATKTRKHEGFTKAIFMFYFYFVFLCVIVTSWQKINGKIFVFVDSHATGIHIGEPLGETFRDLCG